MIFRVSRTRPTKSRYPRWTSARLSARFDWSPWNTSTAEMYRKTPAKRLFKQLPLGDLEEHETRVLASDAEVDQATAEVPALAGLPVVDPSEDVIDVEPVEESEQQELA